MVLLRFFDRIRNKKNFKPDHPYVSFFSIMAKFGWILNWNPHTHWSAVCLTTPKDLLFLSFILKYLKLYSAGPRSVFDRQKKRSILPWILAAPTISFHLYWYFQILSIFFFVTLWPLLLFLSCCCLFHSVIERKYQSKHTNCCPSLLMIDQSNGQW